VRALVRRPPEKHLKRSRQRLRIGSLHHLPDHSLSLVGAWDVFFLFGFVFKQRNNTPTTGGRNPTLCISPLLCVSNRRKLRLYGHQTTMHLYIWRETAILQGVVRNVTARTHECIINNWLVDVNSTVYLILIQTNLVDYAVFFRELLAEPAGRIVRRRRRRS
jgi:hypothetical protein